MTKEEASRQYQIPVSVLDEYERWGLYGAVKKVMGNWQYDDTDIERLGIVMSLHDRDLTQRKSSCICGCCCVKRTQKMNV